MDRWLLVRLTGLALGIGLLVAVGTTIMLDRFLPSDITIAPGPGSPIVVVVTGAIATPGMVELQPGARVNDVVIASGGLTAEADLARINLAMRVRDGEQIEIPTMRPTSVVDSSSPGVDTPGTAPGGQVNLNTATVAELDTLPGIGPVIAQRIIDFRDFYGPFTTIEQLVEVEGISPEMLEEIRPLVTIDE